MYRDTETEVVNMKVKLHRIAPDEEEYAALYTSREDASLMRLKNYIESEDYHTVVIHAEKNGALYSILSSTIYYI